MEVSLRSKGCNTSRKALEGERPKLAAYKWFHFSVEQKSFEVFHMHRSPSL